MKAIDVEHAVQIKLNCDTVTNILSHRHGVARYETVMELRDYLEQLGAMAGANKDEKGTTRFLINTYSVH